VACHPDEDTGPEVTHRAVPHGDAIVAEVEQPDVAELAPRARLDRLAVAGDRVAVQIERDAVGADHDAVVRAVDEVAVERRVGGNRVAAAHVDLLRSERARSEHRPEHGRCQRRP
jgi:hypothetical protein